MTMATDLAETLLPDQKIREIEPGILSVLPPDHPGNSYDASGTLAFYDAVACNSIYNRVMWGYKISELHRFCMEQLEASREGFFLDAGCGSLAFTAKAYARSDRPLVLTDLSLTLLRKARARLQKYGSDMRSTVLLQADITNLPFRDRMFTSILSMNMIHVLEHFDGILSELKRIRTPNGCMGFTTLTAGGGGFRDGYMRMWANKGEIICRDANRLNAEFASAGLAIRMQQQGCMSFIRTVSPN